MCRILGMILFFTGIGIIIGILISEVVAAVIAAIICLISGYYLFCH